jgi:Family of unknown function (DUF5330)
MMFLLRTAFWLSIALALLPSFVGRPAPTAPANIQTSEAVTAASATFADLIQFCQRQPDACAAGAQFASAFRQRAEAGAMIVYEFVGEQVVKREHTAITDLPAKDTKTSQQTLTSTDLAPAWRGPVSTPPLPPRRDMKRPA